MTGFRILDEWLDFAGSVGLEIRSPLFDSGSIPGVLSYPVAFADTPRNRRLLGFPAVRARRAGPVPAVEADFYIGGSLWRRGVLQYKDFTADGSKTTYSYQFQADADALATRIQDVQLSALDLPKLGVQLEADTDDYVLFPVRNLTFYDKDKNADWGGVVNYFPPVGPIATNAAAAGRYTIVPFPKVVPLLRQCLALYGYTVTGPWLDDPEIQQLVVYSLTSLDVATGSGLATEFPLAASLPDVRLADLLLTLQQLFALGFVFNPVRKELRVVALRDVVANAGYQVRRASSSYRDVANELNGFKLCFTDDSDDELLKSNHWPTLTIGGAAEVIQPAADTLRMVREADPLSLGRQWLVPAAEQAGRSARTDFDQTDKRASHLRFLFYRGLQPDSTGCLYPLGSSGTVNYRGQAVGNYALEWDGPQGLYAQWHQPWLDFRANARTEERTVALNLGEFLTLDPTQKDMVQGLKFLWESISLDVGGTQTLEPATITYHQVAR
jgi:hypothetical protein